jgi:type IV pilus assembly protein PilW
VDDGVNDGTVTYNTVYAPNDGIVDRYVSVAPNWSQVIAVRVAVVARSALPETGSGGPGSPCDTTNVAPTWSGATSAARGFDLSADANWKCYRYRVFETTVPLRNWLWKSS